MTKRDSSKAPDQPLYLIMAREEAATRIDARISLGKAFMNKVISSERELEVLKKDYFTWDEYNGEMLRQMFTSTKLADELLSLDWI